MRGGKGTGNGGKGEHEGKGGVGRKGTQQVENLVMDETQENQRRCEAVSRDDAEGGRGPGGAAGPSDA